MVDATKVSKIKIETGYAGVKEYPFFTRESKNGQALPDARCAIILGKNGSGKSTIARALSDGDNRVEFFDKDGNSLGGDCSNVYIFSENFINYHTRSNKKDFMDKIDFQRTPLFEEPSEASNYYKYPIEYRVGRIQSIEYEIDYKQSIEYRVDQKGDTEVEINNCKDSDWGGGKRYLEGSSIQKVKEEKYVMNHIDKLGPLEKWTPSLWHQPSDVVVEYILKTGTDIIIEKINSLLFRIFSEDRISLVSNSDEGIDRYKVAVNGREVAPRMLSTGEQNIVALCYFFVGVLGDGLQKGFKEGLRGNKIIVLDDPVSSFDSDNKYGVTVLLGYLFQYVLAYNSEAKLIIMTHDSSFALNMSKMIKTINSNLSEWSLQGESDGLYGVMRFDDFDKFDEYARILKEMYKFILEEKSLVKVPRANDVRRVWEAFLCFELGETAISDMNMLKNMIECFGLNQKKEEFIKGFIPQLFINLDSHAKDQVRDGNFYLKPGLVGDPYKDFVKHILCFIHIVSPMHIPSRIPGKNEEKKERKRELDNLLNAVLGEYK